MPDPVERDESNAADEDRRRFLATCGRFAGTVPPAMVMLLSTSLSSKAIAKSSGGGGHRGGKGHGKGHGRGGGKGHGKGHGKAHCRFLGK